jgi:UDP-3-O-[3-hydroxymyristoyl] glucosamine N-acyltransferase
LRRTEAGAVLVTPDLQRDADTGRTLLIVADAGAALSTLSESLVPPPPTRWGIHPTACLGSGCRWTGRISIGARARLGGNVLLGTDCWIGPHAIVEDGASLGDACRIEAGALVHRGTRLGDRVVVRTGARVGGAGFGFTRTPNGPRRLAQLGNCIIEHDVEIGANATVDRGGLGDTIVGAGTKIDNLVQIAHNVRVGARCIIMAQVGIAGSTTVEDDVMLAGQAGLADHLTVGRGARVAAQGGVIGDVAPGATVSGYPARDHRTVLRQVAAVRKLVPLVPSLERMLETHERT